MSRSEYDWKIIDDDVLFEKSYGFFLLVLEKLLRSQFVPSNHPKAFITRWLQTVRLTFLKNENCLFNARIFEYLSPPTINIAPVKQREVVTSCSHGSKIAGSQQTVVLPIRKTKK